MIAFPTDLFIWRDKPGASAIVALALISALPLIGYQFGVGSQVEQFSIIARVLDPGFLAGDFFLNSAAGFGPRFYYTRALAALVVLIPLPAVIFGLTLVFNFLLALVTYRATRVFMRADMAGGLVAAMLVVLNESFSLGLAGNLHFESFQPASIAIPLSFAGFGLLIAGRGFLAIPVLVAASIFHPLIGVEIALIGYGSAAAGVILIPGSEQRFGKPLGQLVLSGFMFAIAIFAIWVMPALGTGAEKLSDAEFFDTLARLRAPHHYLGLGFPRRAWLVAILFTASIAVIFAKFVRAQGISRETAALAVSVTTVVALCLASLWFVDIAESRLWVTAQVFRMVMIIKWVGFLALGWLCMGWLREGSFAGIALTASIVVASAEAQAYVIVIALITKFAIDARLLRGALAPAAVVVALVAGLYFTRKYGIQQQSVRALVAFFAVTLILSPLLERRIGLGLAIIFTSLVITITTLTRENGFLDRRSLQAQFGWSDITGDDAEVTRQAAMLSPADALWIVPPDFESFRLLARRAVVADFTSIPFGDQEMREWRQRLDALYGPFRGGGFAALKEMRAVHLAGTNLPEAAARFNADYAILYKETPWAGLVLFENRTFKIVWITGGE